MEISVIKIGNSKGIRFSKMLLEKYNITDAVDLIMDDDKIVIKPISKPRKGWDKAFEKMAQNGDENLEEWK